MTQQLLAQYQSQYYAWLLTRDTGREEDDATKGQSNDGEQK